MLVKSNN